MMAQQSMQILNKKRTNMKDNSLLKEPNYLTKQAYSFLEELETLLRIFLILKMDYLQMKKLLKTQVQLKC